MLNRNHNQNGVGIRHRRHSISSTDSEPRAHQLDLYSIPVFIFEVAILGLLLTAAYFIHCVHYIEPLVSGFYCDDLDYRHKLTQSMLTKHLIQEEDEIVIFGLIVAIPITMIIFCELINSMFGSIRFRRIRALCKCCKLHSITRRSIRFCGAFLLGLLIVSISCDIISSSAGRLRPYFQHECQNAYTHCATQTPSIGALSLSLNQEQNGRQTPDGSGLSAQAASLLPVINSRNLNPDTQTIQNNMSSRQDSSIYSNVNNISNSPDASSPISERSTILSINSTTSTHPPAVSAALIQIINDQADGSRIREAIFIPERKWIDLTQLGSNMASICNFHEPSASSQELYHFRQLAKSWPSHPGALFTYACLFLAAYLSFAGTARPVRIVSCTLVMTLIMVAIIYNVQLVKEHLHHSDDVIAGAGLAALVTLFVIVVYLNLFRDIHYYEKQKMVPMSRKMRLYDNMRTSHNRHHIPTGSEFGTYNLDESMNNSDHAHDDLHQQHQMTTLANGRAGETLSAANDAGAGHTASNNDLAMRYFQIPRANYRNN